MLKIRLQRIGRRNQPFYRVVVTDSKFGPKSGRFLEVVGSYNPKAGEVIIKKDRVQEWIGNGAKVSGTVHNFLVDQGIIKGKKLNVLPKKSPTKKRNAPDEPEPAPEAPAAEAAPVEDAPSEAGEAPAEEKTEEAQPVAETIEATPAEEEPTPSEVEEKTEETPTEEPKEEEKKEAE